MKPALYYALLSGEHPTIPFSELKGILESESKWYSVRGHFEGVVLFDSNLAPESLGIITRRAGWIKEVGILVDVVEAEEESIVRSVISSIRDMPEVCIKVSRFKGYSPHIDINKLKIYLKKYVKCRKDSKLLHIFITEGIAIIGWIVSTLDTRSLYYRKPGKRPFFKPGPLSPQLTRAMINLSRLKRGGYFVDPFCGTGGFVLEACYIGAGSCYCGDIDFVMARGSIINLKYYNVYSKCVTVLHNAIHTPLSKESVDSIATDPPYGRSTTTKRMSYEVIVAGFLHSVFDSLKPGGFVVFAGPVMYRPHAIALKEGYIVVERHQMHVHSTLTREVVVVRKPM